MKIVHAARQYPPGIGGVENLVSLLAEGQARAGHDVRVVTLDRIFDGDGAKLPHRERRNGVEIRRVGFVGSTKYPIAPGAIRHLADCDIVHVHGIDFFADYLAHLRPLHRKPMVISSHGGFFHTSFAQRLKAVWFQTITRASMAHYARVIASSEQDAETFRRIAAKKTVAVENGVDIGKFAGLATPATRVMIYFGRLAPNKGLDLLLPWFKRLLAIEPDWRLIIAGKPMGVGIETLRGLIDSLGIGSNIELHDTPTDAALADLICRSSVYACASRYEGFGLAAVEAIAAGLYPLLSDIAPFRRTVSRVAFGTLVDFGTGGGQERFLEGLRGHRLPQEELARRLEPFEWGAILEQIEQIYRDVLAGRR